MLNLRATHAIYKAQLKVKLLYSGVAARYAEIPL